MTILPIRNDEDYETALEEIDALWDAEPDTPEADRLDVLFTLVEAYEQEHYPIPPPEPIEYILHVMETRELSEKDMEEYLGAHVSEILNRQVPLTLEMIRKLSQGLNLAAEVLIQEYPLHLQAA